MGRMTIKSGPDEEKENVVIYIEEDGNLKAWVILDPATVAQHIHDLAKHRAALNDQVPTELEPVSLLATIINPVCRTPGHRTVHGRVLVIRHPGLGWLSFAIPDKEAASIAEWLTKDLPLDG